MSADLNGKKVLVTGASSGIGLATVETFARGGVTVAFLKINNFGAVNYLATIRVCERDY